MSEEQTIILPRGARVRYLAKQPNTVIFVLGKMRLHTGTWERVWSRKWHSHRGEKKIVSGKTVLVHVDALPGWA